MWPHCRTIPAAAGRFLNNKAFLVGAPLVCQFTSDQGDCRFLQMKGSHCQISVVKHGKTFSWSFAASRSQSFWSPWVSRVDKWYIADCWHAIRMVVRRIDWNMLKCQHLLVQPRAVTPSGNTATGFGDCRYYTDWEKPSQKAGWREAQPLLLSTSEIFRLSLGMSMVWRNTEWRRAAPGLVGHCPPNICHSRWDLASPRAEVPSEVFLRIRGGMTAVFGPWGALCWGHCQGHQARLCTQDLAGSVLGSEH